MDQPNPRTLRAQLLDAMRTGEYAHCGRLPRESALSQRLGISRTQLRDILAMLEREGFITRRHGVGTLINRHVLNVPTRMDIEVELLELIRRAGYEPSVAFVQVSETRADEATADRLRIEAGSPVIRVSRLCAADGRPAIYCEDLFAKALIRRQDYTLKDLKRPIFDFLRQFCGVSVYLDLTDVTAVTADAALAEVLRISVGAPLLRMDEVDYDMDGRPVFCSREYFVEGLLRHTVLRKKL